MHTNQHERAGKFTTAGHTHTSRGDCRYRLARFFNMSPEFWMGLQADYEMALARHNLARELKAIQPFKPPLPA